MSAFHDLLDEYLGEDDALTDIRVTVRRCWFYDFDGEPLRLWQGKGKLFTTDSNEWLGTVNALEMDYHITPALQDGRDGTSASYEFSMTLFDIPGESAGTLYQQLKEEQWRVAGRKLTCYLTIIKEDEGLRPVTPIIYFKQLTMQSPRFAEKVEMNPDGVLMRSYTIKVTAKDANFGRSKVPSGTYADTIQKQRAKQLGVTLDRGAEFLALLANRSYQIP